MNNPVQQFEQERKKVLSEKLFPSDKLSDEFKQLLHRCMMHTSFGRCQCPESTYINMITFERPFFMPEVTMMLNIIKGTTPVELNMSLTENLNALNNIHNPVRDIWRDMDDEISTPIINKINNYLKQNNLVPVGTNVFNFVKAEA